MNAPGRFLDLHALQTLPASCLNRSEDNEPKTLLYGNTVRAMVSPQCWKRVIRTNLEDRLDEHAVRTRMLPARVSRRLRSAGWPEDLARFAALQVVRCAGGDGLATDPQAADRTLAMPFLPESVLQGLAELCDTYRADLEDAAAEAARPATSTDDTATTAPKRQTKKKKPELPAVLPVKAVNALVTSRTATINLLGRMLAGIPGGHVSGALHLAPAFTVHTSDPQPDFFTTVEDWPDSHDSGSAHLQTAFFTTGVYYRYATVNVTELTGNLDSAPGATARLLRLFTEEFLTSLPQAKRTSTAAHTLPYLIHYSVRDRRPVSYAAAFEQPVPPARTGGYTDTARQTLADYAAAITRLTGTTSRVAHGQAGIHQTPLDPLGTHHASYEDLITACTAAACPTTDAQPAGAQA
jgi:CRISPR system Cascade subunit CasC